MSATAFDINTMSNGARCLKLNEWNEKAELALIKGDFDCVSIGRDFGSYSKLEPFAKNIRWLWNPSEEVSLKDIGVLQYLERIDLVVGSEWEHFDYRDLPSLKTFRCKSAHRLNPTLLNCPTLRNLEVYSCRKLKSLELLSSLVNIESLIIRGSPLKDLKGVENFKSLVELRLANCNSLLDISALSSLLQLKILELYNNIKLENLGNIGNLYGLKALFVLKSRLGSQDSWAYLSKMTELNYAEILIRTNNIDYDVIAKHRSLLEVGLFSFEGYELPSSSELKSKLERFGRKVEEIYLYPKDQMPALVARFKPDPGYARDPKHTRKFSE